MKLALILLACVAAAMADAGISIGHGHSGKQNVTSLFSSDAVVVRRLPAVSTVYPIVTLSRLFI